MPTGDRSGQARPSGHTGVLHSHRAEKAVTHVRSLGQQLGGLPDAAGQVRHPVIVSHVHCATARSRVPSHQGDRRWQRPRGVSWERVMGPGQPGHVPILALPGHSPGA